MGRCIWAGSRRWIQALASIRRWWFGPILKGTRCSEDQKMSLLSSRGSCIYPPPAVRNLPAEWNSKSLQFSCLENPIDRGASSMGSQSLNMTERLTCSLSLCNHKAHLQIYPTACFCHLTPLFVMGKRRQLGCLLQSHFQRLLKVKVKVAQSCLTLQQSMEFSRSEYWSG